MQLRGVFVSGSGLPSTFSGCLVLKNPLSEKKSREPDGHLIEALPLLDASQTARVTANPTSDARSTSKKASLTL